MKKEDLKQAIVILGMHRSGTSALTRVLSLCGATLPKHLMKPVDQNNETGFWESEQIMQLNDELLTSLGSAWDDISPLPPNWFNAVQISAYKKRLLDSLREEFETSNLIVLKDPRLCRLLPLWLDVLEAFEAQPKIVIPIRHPLEIAASLKKRDGFTCSKSLLLWLQHFLCAERDTRDIPRTFISYSSLLDDWRGVVHQIETDLDFSFPTISHTTTLESEAFLHSGLRHHLISKELADRPDIVNWVAQAYDWAIKVVDGQAPNVKELDAIYGAYAEADKAFGAVVTGLSQDLERLKQRYLQLQGQLSQAQNQLQQTQNQLRQTKDEASQLRSELSDAQQDVMRMRRRPLQKLHRLWEHLRSTQEIN
ncbi:MAG: hypothetical protein AAF921_01335 [Cyanobacteria bacterium P01_D01_bin.44]